MDISPPSPATPPSLWPTRTAQLAGLPSPVARRNLHPYLSALGLPKSALNLPKDYSLSLALALAEGDKGDTSVSPRLITMLRAVIDETRVGGGLYLRDMVNLCRTDLPPLPWLTTVLSNMPEPARCRRARRPRVEPAPAPRE
jgi:hypothetical protein